MGNKHKCNCEIKKHFHMHKQCRKDRSVKKSGIYLNQYVENEPFENNEEYQLCYTISLMFDKTILPLNKKQPKRKVSFVTVQCSGLKDDDMDEVSNEVIDLRDDNECDNYDKDEEEEEEEKEKEKLPKKKFKFIDKIVLFASNYKLPFHRLKWRKRLERIDDVASRIIACCIDKKEVKLNGIDYYKGNEEFAHEVLNIVNGIQERLSLKLNVDLRAIEDPMPIELSPSDEDNNHLDDSTLKMAYTIMGEATGRGYERIRKHFNEINPDHPLPSVYLLNKHLPTEFEAIEFDVGGEEDDDDMNEMEKKLYGISKDVKSEQEALVMFSQMKTKQKMIGAKIVGTLKDFVALMKKKHEVKGVSIKDGEDIIILSSFDGAEAMKSDNNSISVISYSSSMLTPRMIQSKEVRAGASFNILTWMQVIGKEELKVLQCTLKDYFEERRKYTDGTLQFADLPNSKIYCYDVHDGKMLYLLLQHSMWNRKHHPFILCKCKRGEGVNSRDHQCDMWTDDNYMKSWERSDKRFLSKQSRAPNYDVKLHRDWCDQQNHGVTHFGISPALLPVSTVRFDVFHLKCAITRMVMNHVRTLILKHSTATVKAFTDNVLSSFWSNFHVYCWNNKLKFSKFQGNDLALFIVNINKVTRFLSEKLANTSEVTNLVGGLSCMPDLFQFMAISHIQNHETYMSKLVIFEESLKDFYEFGRNTYLSENETFYSHCFRFYMPRIARTSYERHKVGLGIFSMQGFERRNKESKNALRRFATMNRGSPNLMVNNLKRLLHVYLYEINAY